jgi:hypothetical protein
MEPMTAIAHSRRYAWKAGLPRVPIRAGVSPESANPRCFDQDYGGFMGKEEELNALREATLAASEITSPPASLKEVDRARGHRDLLIRQAHAAGASVKEIVEATHLAPDQIDATIAKPGL